MDILSKIEETEQKIQAMLAYMQLKIKQRDFHAIADAAMDIREMEERIKVYKELLNVDKDMQLL
jgi:hypothetical protein